METINESSLGSGLREAIKRAQQVGQPVEITDANGQVVAHIIPTKHHANALSTDEAWIELTQLIASISPHLPEHVDAVEAVRDVRR